MYGDREAESVEYNLRKPHRKREEMLDPTPSGNPECTKTHRRGQGIKEDQRQMMGKQSKVQVVRVFIYLFNIF